LGAKVFAKKHCLPWICKILNTYFYAILNASDVISTPFLKANMPAIYIIATEHELYPQVIALRQRILRAPLGLDINDDDLQSEVAQIIFIYEEDKVVKGCVLLQHYDAETFKLRQMAVDASMQGKGIGAELVNAADVYAVQLGKHKMVLHARATAVGFYEKLGYEVVDEPLIEVGLPHRKMEKLLV